ncbi:MAG: membrane protein insertase YidC, partial [Saprospiraceae bacterium]|nr:membrane protein insertase YidC [Saprospiraceae bacterium]
KNSFSYRLPVPSAARGYIETADLYFVAEQKSNRLTFTADLGGGRRIQQVYTLSDDSYDLEYDLRLEGMHQVLDSRQDNIELRWVNYLDRIEENYQYEKIFSTVYYKEVNDDPSYCSCRSDDSETLDEEPVKWVSNSNQFFNSALIAREAFRSAVVETKMLDEESEDLKLLVSEFAIPYQGSADETFSMDWYIGPNDFEILQSYNIDLQDIIPFGSSIFGTINRWIIRPIFNFLSNYIGSKGIVILLLTLIVKSLVYPLTFKMLHSQSKMGALKPEMAKLKDKYKDDQQKVQMETMKIYREYGVNPAGGCFPMVLQMPIWFALYRFFPASIEFRQASFLWANDLSSYDVFFWLPFEIPFLGGHVSLFTILWAISILAYTYYNSQIMDMSSINPMMKYMQYLMPLMFIFFFNSYASGLTCYLLFSNMLNIIQTVVTKNYLIDNEKILAELNKNKKKPKKKGGFQARLEKALREQQKIAEEKSQKSRRR